MSKKDKEKRTEDTLERQWLKGYIKESKLGQNGNETESIESVELLWEWGLNVFEE